MNHKLAGASLIHRLKAEGFDCAEEDNKSGIKVLDDVFIIKMQGKFDGLFISVDQDCSMSIFSSHAAPDADDINIEDLFEIEGNGEREQLSIIAFLKKHKP